MSQFSRFYFKGKLSIGANFSLQAQEAHHLSHVLKARPGELVKIFTGYSQEFLARIEKMMKDSVELKVLEEKPVVVKPWWVALVQAVPKSKKMDWIIEKATELGVDEIFPVLTNRVVKRTDRIERLRKIACAASEQSGRVKIPEIHSVQSWAEFFQGSHQFDVALVASLQGSSHQRLDQVIEKVSRVKSVALAIGPEGDFSPEEVEEALGRGWILVDLGPLVLRTETAALVGLAILEHELRKKVISYKS